MKKIIFLLLAITISVLGATWDIPLSQKKYTSIDIENYGWMAKNNLTSLSVTTRGDTEKFISKSDIERYVKLKNRNFNKNLKFTNGTEKNFNYSYLEIHVELFKYNDKMDVYFGLISLKVTPSILITKHTRKYTYVMPIAGADTQLKQFIKETIDTMIEKFSEDTYYMEDIVNKK